MKSCYRRLLLLSACSLLGCSQGPTATVRLDGSSTVYPIALAAAEEFGNEHPEVKVTVGFSGTGGGFKRFVAGEIDICDASRPMTELERSQLREHGTQFVEFIIAYDGLSVVVHPSNHWVDCLTVDQLRRIWEPESRVARWSDLDPAWPSEKMNLYGPGHDSGTFDFFTEAIVGRARSSRADYSQSEDDNVIVAGVSQDPFALGYLGMAYVYENRKSLKLLRIDGGNGCIEPTPDNVLSKAYSPLARPLLAYARQDSLRRSEMQQFVRFFLERAGGFAREQGFVPVSEREFRENLDRLSTAMAAGGAKNAGRSSP